MEEENSSELVQLESDHEYYQGHVIANTNVKHGQGTLIDKRKMTQFTGTFINGLKFGDTCKLVALDDTDEIVEYTGGFVNDLFHGMGILVYRDGRVFKGDFYQGNPKEGIVRYANGDEYTGPVCE